MKKVKILAIIICAILVIAGGLFGTYKLFFDPYRGTVSVFDYTSGMSEVLTREQVVEDTDYVLRLLKERHPACMDGLPEAVEEQSRVEKDNIPEQPTVLWVWQASARILAKMNDAHTTVNINMEDDDYLPIAFRYNEGRLYCAEGEYADCAVISIGGVTTDDLFKTFKSQFSYEQEGYAAYRFARLCHWKDDLAFMNIDVSGSVDFVFETPDGEVSISYDFEKYEPVQESQDTPFVSYEIDRDNGVGILTLTECNYNDVYRETLNEFFTEAKVGQIQTVVVDLRENNGGNSLVANEFIRYLDVDRYYAFGRIEVRFGPILWKNKRFEATNKKHEDLLFHDSVYVLTSPRTFSSATNFAVMLSDSGLGKIAGETSGGMPTSYGDVLKFQTPNAKLMYTISYKRFHRPDDSKDSLPLMPDYPAPTRDALEMVYEIIK